MISAEIYIYIYIYGKLKDLLSEVMGSIPAMINHIYRPSIVLVYGFVAAKTRVERKT